MPIGGQRGQLGVASALESPSIQRIIIARNEIALCRRRARAAALLGSTARNDDDSEASGARNRPVEAGGSQPRCAPKSAPEIEKPGYDGEIKQWRLAAAASCARSARARAGIDDAGIASRRPKAVPDARRGKPTRCHHLQPIAKALLKEEAISMAISPSAYQYV